MTEALQPKPDAAMKRAQMSVAMFVALGVVQVIGVILAATHMILDANERADPWQWFIALTGVPLAIFCFIVARRVAQKAHDHARG